VNIPLKTLPDGLIFSKEDCFANEKNAAAFLANERGLSVAVMGF
jgi:hypothetical protein